MSLEWIRESPAKWDDGKAHIIGEAPPGIFDPSYRELEKGELLPAEWWRVEENGNVVGYGWLDVVWGDAEILLATALEARKRGVGTFVMGQLEREARERGVNYLYNVVPSTHPNAAELTRWLEKRGFKASEDGRLLRSVVPPEASK